MIWDFDPVAFTLFGWPVRWYGLVYVAGFFLASFFGWRIYKTFPSSSVSRESFESLVFGTFFSGVIGGRVGEFLFYTPNLLWEHPFQIFQIWTGGMSFHGGVLGGLIFLYLWSRKRSVSLLSLSDALVLPLAITLIFGRFANFLNGELVGVPTYSDWGVIFPHVDDLLRHPTQLYESFKNLVLSLLLFWGWKKFPYKKGNLTLIFLFGYAGFRFIIEFWKNVGWSFIGLSAGQWLSFLFLIWGAFLWCSLSKKRL